MDRDVLVRPLVERDLPAAERIFRLAFGTFIGAPDPETCFADRDLVRARWHADPTAAFGAEVNGELVGSNFAANWGSFGFFGPLTIRPDLWDRGIGQALVGAVMQRFETWGTKHVGLFTFAHSSKHLSLYQKFGFWPRFLTAIMGRQVTRTAADAASWSRYSELPDAEREATLAACRSLTNSVYPGLDVETEIRSVRAQQLGDTLLLRDDEGVAAFAVCHFGPPSEAGAGACYIKFGVARCGDAGEREFGRLLDACEELADAEGMFTLVAGVNLARHEAYRQLIERGFRTESLGVAMQRPNEAGYNRAGVYVIDDWR